jgi:small nuclear ribonucleoprotein (snRNP)-like protein
MATSGSVPVKVLHESEGHTVTVELKTGELYRGQLDSSEDTMNVALSNVVHTGRDGRVTKCVAEGWRERGGGRACGPPAATPIRVALHPAG